MKLSSWIREGSIVAWWDGSSLELGVVRGEDKRRIVIVRERGHEARVNATRVAFEVAPPGTVPGGTPDARREAGARASDARERLDRRAAGVDVPLLWSVVTEDGADAAAFSPGELAGLAFDRVADTETPADADAAALTLALLSDGVHFVRKGEVWQPRDASAVRDLLLERERIRLRETETADVLARIGAAAGGGTFVPGDGAVERRFLEALERVALFEDTAPDAARSLVGQALDAARNAAGMRWDRPHEGAFRLLRKLGRFASDDENLGILRHGLRTAFPSDVLEHAEASAARPPSRTGRVDLTGIETLSIDGPTTREIDDALSIDTRPGGGLQLGVHIADPGAFVDDGDPVDREAFARGLTHYMPELKLTMLPSIVSEEAASLVAGAERPALSFLIDLDDEARVLRHEIRLSIIRCDDRLTYRDADRTLQTGAGAAADRLRLLARVAGEIEAARIRDGAAVLHSPDVDVHVDAEGVIRLERLEADSPSRRIVGEAMILAGKLAALHCTRHGLPAGYRRQPAPSDPPEIPAGGVRDPIAVFDARRRLTRGELSLEPGAHYALGLPEYAQVTSPLRRYLDLANHRQIGSHLRGDPPPYDREAMLRIVANADATEREARRAERAGRDYWMLRYLETRTGQNVSGTVVEVLPRPLFQLDETLWMQAMPSLTGVERGERIRVKIERVNPRAGLLVLRRVAGEDA